MDKDKKALTEITEATFIELIQKSIDNIEDRIGELQGKYTTIQRLYRDYERDKENYNLKYYVKDGCIMYDKLPKVIGYKR